MKTTKSDLKRIIREELENVLTEGQFYGDDEMMDDDRREELISMIYDIMKDNRSGNQEEDFAAAKVELEEDGLASEQELKKITFERWQALSGVN